MVQNLGTYTKGPNVNKRIMIASKTNPVTLKEISEIFANFAIPSQRERGRDKHIVLFQK